MTLQKTQRAYLSLSTALINLEAEQPEQTTIDTAIKRGYFLPEEDDILWSLIARYLTIRSGFWEIISDMSAHFVDNVENIKTLDDWRHFLLGYASSCQAVYMSRLLIDDMAKHKRVQRKINEGAPQHRIPRKVFTTIFDSLSDADNAIKMQYMMNFVDDNRAHINTMMNDDTVASIVKNLEKLESSLHSSQLNYIKLRLRYIWHALTRRGASSKQTASFFILEKAGRVVAELGDHSNKRVTPEIQTQLAKLLQAGDVIITRHDFVASNLFLPGYWPHAALYIGSEDDRKALGIDLDESIANRWKGNIRTLEAQKDGVLFRPLNETLNVDELIIIRPNLSPTELAIGLTRVCQHEGKGYNFDFDFFSSNKLVCTEVIYRAFDGLRDDGLRDDGLRDEGFRNDGVQNDDLQNDGLQEADEGIIKFKLIERAGRLSLSAEDILDMAVNNQGFKPVAIVGLKSCHGNVVMGEEALEKIKGSYSAS